MSRTSVRKSMSAMVKGKRATRCLARRLKSEISRSDRQTIVCEISHSRVVVATRGSHGGKVSATPVAEEELFTTSVIILFVVPGVATVVCLWRDPCLVWHLPCSSFSGRGARSTECSTIAAREITTTTYHNFQRPTPREIREAQISSGNFLMVYDTCS